MEDVTQEECVDFKQIAQTPILDVAAKLGLRLTERGEQFVAQCPISQNGNPTAFKITPKLNRFICFCSECKNFPKQGGDCIELVRRVRRVEHREAAAFILNGAARTADNASSTSAEPEAASRKPDSFDPLAYVKTLATEHEALKDLNILPETLVAFQAGYSSKGLNRGRLAVAWHNVEGELQAFVGVGLKGEVPQYLMPKGQPLPYWFGTHRIEEGAEVHIVPSILHALEAWENGATNTLAPMRPVDADSLTCLLSLVKAKNLTIEF